MAFFSLFLFCSVLFCHCFRFFCVCVCFLLLLFLFFGVFFWRVSLSVTDQFHYFLNKAQYISRCLSAPVFVLICLSVCMCVFCALRCKCCHDFFPQECLATMICAIEQSGNQSIFFFTAFLI